jgi:hypothetical protein
VIVWSFKFFLQLQGHKKKRVSGTRLAAMPRVERVVISSVLSAIVVDRSPVIWPACYLGVGKLCGANLEATILGWPCSDRITPDQFGNSTRRATKDQRNRQVVGLRTS